MAFSHGSNDAQKSMGIITLALVSGGFITSLEVPDLVKFLCAWPWLWERVSAVGKSSAPSAAKSLKCTPFTALQLI